MADVGDAARSESGLPIEPVYGAGALDGFDPDAALGEPGEFPFTRGVYPSMYTGRPWTMRQYAGFGTAKESNERYHELVAAGTGGLSVAFDLPTQMGYDSDEPIAHGEVGKVGVAIDSVDDMRVLFGGLPLDKISTSMTINAPAATLLLMYQLVAEEQGVARGPADRDDPERRAQGVHRPRHLHLPAAGVAAADQRHLRATASGRSRAGTRSPSPATTWPRRAPRRRRRSRSPSPTPRSTCGPRIAAGLDVDDFAPRLSFFFVARTTLLEEIAKFRAARADLGADHAR